MPRAAAFSAAMLLGFAAVPASAAEVAPPVPAQLVNRTLSAVAYVPHPATMPGGGELSRFMFQAYLRANGSAIVRVWDTARDSYTAPAERRWDLSADTLCVDLSGLGPGRICAEIHVWGPRIAGVGVKPYAMLDGDLEPGDEIAGRR